MTRTSPVAALFLALALAGCGGGGSGSSGGDGGDGSSGGGGGGSSGGGGGGAVNSDGTGEIVFPWTRSTATAQTVTVNGTAIDSDGVARVLVNGLTATITATGPTSSSGAITKASLAEGEVAWSAEVALTNGENALAVSVEDASGNVTDDVDTASIRYVEVPITFTFDPDGTRVVGLSFTATPGGFEQNLIEHDYVTLEQTNYGSVDRSPATSCFRRFEDEFLYLSFFTGTWELRSYDLATRQDVLLTEILPADLDGGVGFDDGSVRQLVCGGTHASAYVLVNHVETGGSSYAKSRVLQIDLASFAITTLSETDTTAATPWIAQHIALAEDRIVSLRDISPTAPLTSVSLADGTRSDLTPNLNVGGFVVQPELTSNRTYVATFEGIDEINLVAGTRQNISIVDDDDPLAFAQIRAIGFDGANNRVVVGDSDLDKLIAIDTTTGERSEFLSRNAGTGISLVAPRAFAISADASRAYVADDGGNVAERLFEIDLTTGDRRVIGDIQQPFNYVVTGLALDETANRVFVAFQHQVLEVDLDTEAVRTVANINSTALDSIHGLLLDPANGRLLIGDPANDGIFALDLETLAIDVISQDGIKGNGPAFGTVVSLSGSPTPSEIVVAGQSSETVTRVDLETGNREALVAACDLGGSTTFRGLDQVLYNQDNDELLIRGDGLYSLDSVTEECTALPLPVFLLQIQNASADQILAVSFGTLMQIDRETGEMVIVSK